MRKTKTKKLAICGVLTALALALSLAESAIPLGLIIPLPGIKLGLANVVTLMAIYTLGAPYAVAITLGRVFIVFLVTGNSTALVMSLAGGLISVAAMILCRKSRIFSIYGTSVVGAACHNAGQIIAACLIMRTLAIISYLPVLLCTALATGIITATAADLCYNPLSKLLGDASSHI